jgi:hypothetical protein
MGEAKKNRLKMELLQGGQTKPSIFSLDFFGDEYRYSNNIELQEQ